MIELQNINKTFSSKNSTVAALKNVSLKIEQGEIFGIIGLSGAGKSTLIRHINLLERPDSGKVIVDGDDLTALSPKEVWEKRSSIGMIFQHFNLFRLRTIAQNIAFPLEYRKLSRDFIDKRVQELLELVELESKINVYPSQLSGGQKQRVGIARALAHNPKVLLCDEATSALDPKTTQSILALLKNLNKKLGLTIVLVTHEMSVVKSICDKTAVMEGGEVIETGSVFEIFTKPKHQITKDFIATTSIINKIHDLLEENALPARLKPGETLVHFSYEGPSAVEALISTISATFDVKANIIFADLDIVSDMPIGGLVLIFSGTAENQKQAFEFAAKKGIRVEVIKQYGNS